MKLDFLPLDKLTVSKSNMRYGKQAPDVSDILPTIRKRGVLQPVIVRRQSRPEPVEGCALTNDDGAMFEIVAGARRFTAAGIVADERRAAGEEVEQLPCAILDADDDAAAIEVSMIENMARRDADEVTQWESFTRLVKEGREIADIAATFGLPDLTVKRILALGNVLPRIRALYAKEEIDRATVRHLTLASKSQQRAWLALADDPDGYAPHGHQLKAWLFGGQSVAVKHALFDVAASGLATVADLFGEDAYFADADAFWTAQNAAVAARCEDYRTAGWADAIVVGPDTHFSTWEYERAAKRKGGKVYFDVRQSGEVAVHEGYLSRKEAARLARGEPGETPKVGRPEVTSTMQTYLDLHRHAAVRADLLAQPQVALRLMVAHAINGSPLWLVSPQSQTCRDDAVTASVAGGAAQTAFAAQRRAVLALLGFGEDEPTVTGGNTDEGGLVGLFQRLLDLPDRAVLEVVAIVIGETLASGSAAVAALGLQLGTDMARHWRADDAFFTLIRDKQVTNALLADVAGADVAAANAGEKTAAQQAIIRDCLAGTNGRVAVAGWVPKWLAFPPAAYTDRGGVGTIRANVLARAALVSVAEDDAPDLSSDAGDADADAENAPVALAA